jgi:hypothetical protein
MTFPNSEIIDQLKQASDGLLMMCESEYPFEVFQRKTEQAPLTQNKVLEKNGYSQNTPVKVVEVDDFFQVATTEEDWHDEEEKETVKKFQNLVNTLKSNLKNLEIYRIGSKEIDVYIIGTTPNGDLAGISTKVVET